MFSQWKCGKYFIYQWRHNLLLTMNNKHYFDWNIKYICDAMFLSNLYLVIWNRDSFRLILWANVYKYLFVLNFIIKKNRTISFHCKNSAIYYFRRKKMTYALFTLILLKNLHKIKNLRHYQIQSYFYTCILSYSILLNRRVIFLITYIFNFYKGRSYFREVQFY